MAKSQSLAEARAAFLEYYTKELPNLNIEEYLTKSNLPILLISPLHREKLYTEFQKKGYSWKEVSWFPQAIYWPSEVSIDTSLPGFKEGWIYVMNISSLLPVVALDPQPTDTILDAAAAPGGKTLATIAYTEGKAPTIIANDAALPRYKRLVTSLKGFGYPHVVTIHHPVQALPHVLQGHFDKILLDAPCSSEKHVFNSKTHLRVWSPSRIETLAHLQELMINSLLPLLRPGGKFVYSTCALNHTENEAVVQNILEKHPEVSLAAPLNRHNSMTSDFDPMFVATFMKKSA